MGKRGKKVTEQKKAKVLDMLDEHDSVDHIARNQDISKSEVRKIRRDALRKEEQRQLKEAQVRFKVQLVVPAPEAILIDNFGNPGPHSIPLKQDIFRVSWENTGYDTAMLEVIKESWGTAEGKVNVVVLPKCTLELFCPVEEETIFQKLLSSLSETAREQFTVWKQRGGDYLAKCTDIRWEIHTEANDRTFQLIYNCELKEVFSKLGVPSLTPHFGDLIYQLCLLYHRSSGQFGLPDKKLYRVRRRSPILYELYLGHRRLVATPSPPLFLPPTAPPPPFPSDLLEGWADLHRDMIKEWGNSPATLQLLGSYESLHGIEEVIKEELG
ncbi:hypothetical protein ES703_66702 [subsurface metagenome]